MDEFVFNKTIDGDKHKDWIDILSVGQGHTQGRGDNVFGFEDLPNNSADEDDDLPVVIVWDIDG